MVDENPRTYPTEAQIRVLQALAQASMEVSPGDPTIALILNRVIAERLGMTVEEVQAHAQALEDLGLLVQGEVIDEYWGEGPEYEGLTWDARRVQWAFEMAKETGDRNTHRTHAQVAVQLGMTEQEVHDICVDLTARGLLLPGTHGLTDDQKRVLDALPTWRPDMEPGPTKAELAERLGMTKEEVREHIRALDEAGWMMDDGPTSVLDGLLAWGWHTPADELAERLHMNIEEVVQRLLELAEIGYDVRLI